MEAGVTSFTCLLDNTDDRFVIDSNQRSFWHSGPIKTSRTIALNKHATLANMDHITSNIIVQLLRYTDSSPNKQKGNRKIRTNNFNLLKSHTTDGWHWKTALTPCFQPSPTQISQDPTAYPL